MPSKAQLALGAVLLGNAFGTELGHLLRSGHPDHANFGGDHMERTFTSYKTLPVGEDALKAAGWHKHGTECDASLGFAWTEDASGATKTHPMKLYTTAGGQPAGAGIIIFGYGQDPLPEPQKKYATEKPIVGPTPDASTAHIDVAFRTGSIVCSGLKDASNIGDTLIVNPSSSTNKKVLPLKESGAKSEGWMRGSCFDGMGWHYFLDESVGANKLSWKAENLFPVVVMFDNGELNAMFFASMINQVSIPMLKSNEWEPKALSNKEMCMNMCDKDCTFSGLSSAGPWSTAHIYFKDHSSVTCGKNVKCGIPFMRGNCCDSDVLV